MLNLLNSPSISKILFDVIEFLTIFFPLHSLKKNIISLYISQIYQQNELVSFDYLTYLYTVTGSYISE